MLARRTPPTPRAQRPPFSTAPASTSSAKPAIQPHQPALLEHKDHGFFVFPQGFKKATVANFRLKSGAKLVRFKAYFDDQSRGKLVNGLVVRNEEFGWFSGHFANLAKMGQIVNKDLNLDYDSLDPKDLPNTFHTGRRWFFAKTAAIERILVGFDSEGKHLSLQNEPEYKGFSKIIADTIEAEHQHLIASSSEAPPAIKGVVVGLHSLIHLKTVEHFRANALALPELGDFKLTPSIQAFIPNTRDYLTLLDQILHNKLDLKKLEPPYLNVGSGSGALALVLAAHLKRLKLLDGNKAQIVCTDSSKSAVECTLANALAFLGTQHNAFSVQQGDVYPAKTGEKGGQQYSLVVSYPPFIPVSAVRDPYEASLYDVDERMLKILISQLPVHLAPNGRFVLIYPNTATEVLKLRQTDHIKSLCEKYGLQVLEMVQQEADKFELPAHLGEYREPALIYRKRSMVQAYIIGRKKDK